MNGLLKQKIRLNIHEPFEKSESLTGQIVEVTQHELRTYLFITLDKKSGCFVLSERYAEEKFSSITSKKSIHVAIYFTMDNFPNDGNIVDFLQNSCKPYGRGSIDLFR